MHQAPYDASSQYDLALTRENITGILMQYPNQMFKVKEFRSLYQKIHGDSLKPPPGSSLKPTAFFASLKLKNVVVDIEEKTVIFTPNEENFCVQDLVLSSEIIINKMYRDRLSSEENSVLVKIEELRGTFDSVFGKILDGNSGQIEWVKREMGKALETIKTKHGLEEEN